jgi:fibronectin-binding autotransporter adhesin
VSGKTVVNSGGTLAVSAGGAGQWANGDIDTALATATFNTGSGFGINVDQGNTFTYASNVTQSISFGKYGDGELLLSGANTYTGGTNIQGGVLSVGSAGNLGASAASNPVTISNGAALRLLGDFDPFDGQRPLILGPGGGAIDTNGHTASTGITVSGTTLIKLGDGQLTLGGLNQQTGTVVKQGILNIINDANLGTIGAPVTLDGGTLKTPTSYSSARPMIVAAGGGTLDTGTQSVSFGNVDGAGNLSKISSGTVAVSHVRVGDLSVNGGTMQIAPNGSADGVSRVNALSIGAGAKLDLTDNKLIVQSGGPGSWTGSGYDGVSGQVASARGDGTWNGTSGITTSSANGKLTTLGVAKAGDVKGIADGDTATFAGQTVHGSDTIVMYTYGGDANLDGKINIDDYGRIDSNVGFNGTVHGWYNGDFNYDGAINIDDYGIIDSNIGIQGPPIPTAGSVVSAASTLAGVTAVPEPASLALFGAAGAGMLLRRRRRGR